MKYEVVQDGEPKQSNRGHKSELSHRHLLICITQLIY